MMRKSIAETPSWPSAWYSADPISSIIGARGGTVILVEFIGSFKYKDEVVITQEENSYIKASRKRRDSCCYLRTWPWPCHCEAYNIVLKVSDSRMDSWIEPH